MLSKKKNAKRCKYDSNYKKFSNRKNNTSYFLGTEVQDKVTSGRWGKGMETRRDTQASTESAVFFFLKLRGEYVGIQAMVLPFLMPKIFYDSFKVKEKLENTFSQLKNFFKNFKS